MEIQNITPRAQNAIAMAQKLAKQSGETYLGTKHLFLGCLSVNGEVFKGLQELGIDVDELRVNLKIIFDRNLKEQRPPSGSTNEEIIQQIKKLTLELEKRHEDSK